MSSNFWKHASAAFGMHQASKMLKQKRQALDHLCEALTYVAGIGSLHAVEYESSHKHFKAMYAMST